MRKRGIIVAYPRSVKKELKKSIMEQIAWLIIIHVFLFP
jgi:hypothetical protein